MRKTKTNSAIRILSYIVPHWHLVMASTIAGVVKLSMPLILPQVIAWCLCIDLYPRRIYQTGRIDRSCKQNNE